MLSTWTSQNSFFIVPCTRLPVRYWLTEFSVLVLLLFNNNSCPIYLSQNYLSPVYHQRKIGCQKWQDVSKIYSLTFISEIIAFPANKYNLETLSFWKTSFAHSSIYDTIHLGYHLAALLHNNDTRVSKQQVARLISDCFLSTLCAFMIMIGSDNLEKWS